MNSVPIRSTDGDELARNGHSCPEQVLSLLYPWIQEALLAEGRVHVTRHLRNRQIGEGTEIGIGEERLGRSVLGSLVTCLDNAVARVHLV